MVTVPTIDQISGTTVMNKLRALIRKFIEFATDVSDEMEDVSEQSQEAYNIASSINISNYYTKAEVDAIISSIDLSQFYTKVEIDGMFENLAENIDGEIERLDGRIDGKQNSLTPIAPIIIAENNISLKDWTVYDSLDWRGLADLTLTHRPTTKDMIVKVTYLTRSRCYYIPKGTSSATTIIEAPAINTNNSTNGRLQIIGFSENLGNLLNSSESQTYFTWGRIVFDLTMFTNSNPCYFDLDKSSERIYKKVAETELNDGVCIYVRD